MATQSSGALHTKYYYANRAIPIALTEGSPKYLQNEVQKEQILTSISKDPTEATPQPGLSGSLTKIVNSRPLIQKPQTIYSTIEYIDGPFWLQLADVGIIWLAESSLLYIECRCCEQRLTIDTAREHILHLHNQSPTKAQWQRLRVGYGIGFKPGFQWATTDQLSNLSKILPPIQRVQHQVFRTRDPIVAPVGVQYLKGPDWLACAEVKVCLIQDLQLASYIVSIATFNSQWGCTRLIVRCSFFCCVTHLLQHGSSLHGTQNLGA
ncbi:hypothetical protein BGX38DRAFT_244038 [Terfezia claveryi]|nr:hypothetical protein BGX38DRAFT_244038 [Terfezia claveryi]